MILPGLCKLYFFCGTILVSVCVQAQVNIIPQPAALQISTGHFIIDDHTALQFNPGNSDPTATAKYFTGRVDHVSGIKLPINNKAAKYIRFGIDKQNGLSS